MLEEEKKKVIDAIRWIEQHDEDPSELPGSDRGLIERWLSSLNEHVPNANDRGSMDEFIQKYLYDVENANVVLNDSNLCKKWAFIVTGIPKPVLISAYDGSHRAAAIIGQPPIHGQDREEK